MHRAAKGSSMDWAFGAEWVIIWLGLPLRNEFR